MPTANWLREARCRCSTKRPRTYQYLAGSIGAGAMFPKGSAQAMPTEVTTVRTSGSYTSTLSAGSHTTALPCEVYNVPRMVPSNERVRSLLVKFIGFVDMGLPKPAAPCRLLTGIDTPAHPVGLVAYHSGSPAVACFPALWLAACRARYCACYIQRYLRAFSAVRLLARPSRRPLNLILANLILAIVNFNVNKIISKRKFGYAVWGGADSALSTGGGCRVWGWDGNLSCKFH